MILNNQLYHEYFKLLIKFNSFPRIKHRRTFLEISGFPHYENVYSNILAFYLNPRNEHELNDLVLCALVKLACNNFEFGKSEHVQLHREFETFGKNRLDILLFTESYAICVENKIYHHLSNDLAEYKRTVEKISSTQHTQVYIVLSLQKLTSKDDLLKMQENNFVNITYEQLFQSIKQNIGDYISASNATYVNYLLDFMKTIQNLTPMNNQNHELHTFFKENHVLLQELADGFNHYKDELFTNHIILLKERLSYKKNVLTNFNQWIYNKRVLVHDFTNSSRYKIVVDTALSFNGWEIQIFGRNTESTEFVFNSLLRDNNFSSQTEEGCPKVVDKRLLYRMYEFDTEIDIIADSLSELLEKIECFMIMEDNNLIV